MTTHLDTLSNTDLDTTIPGSASPRDPAAAIGDALANARSAAGDAVSRASERLPELSDSTYAVMGDARHRIDSSSDQMLAVGSAMAFGAAGGLLIAGAPRLAVAAAMVPAAILALTLFQRSDAQPGFRFASHRGGQADQSRS